MSEDKKLDRIDCHKHGGFRSPHACIVFDKYKSCRKKCPALEQYLKDNPDALKEAEEYLEKQKNKTLLPTKYVGKNLPIRNEKLTCPKCKFEAKSFRGLRTHITRNHPELIPKKKTKKRKRRSSKKKTA